MSIKKLVNNKKIKTNRKKKIMSNEQNNIEPTELTASIATIDDAKINIMCETKDGEIYSFNLYTKKYVKESRKYVDDPETYQQAEDWLNEHGSSIATVEDDALEGKIVFFGYPDDETGRVYRQPRKHFIRFAKIDRTAEKLIRTITDPVEITILDEYHGLRFQPGVVIPGIDEPVRVSQLTKVNPETEKVETLSLRYETQNIRNFREAVQNMDDEDKKKLLDEKIKKLVEIERDKKLAEMSDFTGINMQDVLDGKQELNLTVILETQKVPGGTYAYLVAEIVQD